ncbi:hypothetical protein EMIT0P2_170002 [Pseudomonas sp. IT-P2]
MSSSLIWAAHCLRWAPRSRGPILLCGSRPSCGFANFRRIGRKFWKVTAWPGQFCRNASEHWWWRVCWRRPGFSSGCWIHAVKRSGSSSPLRERSRGDDLFADDDHATAGIAGGVEAKGIITWLFHGVARFCNDFVALRRARVRGTGVALVPRGGQPRTVDVQPFFAVFDLGLRRRRAARNGEYGDQYQNSFHYRPYGRLESDARVCLYALSLEAFRYPYPKKSMSGTGLRG